MSDIMWKKMGEIYDILKEMAIEIVDLVPWKMVIFPSKMVIIHGYVSLPEGIYDIYGIIMGVSMGISRKLCHIEVRSMISMSYQSYLWDIYDIL